METEQHKGEQNPPVTDGQHSWPNACTRSLEDRQYDLAADQCLVLQYYRVASLCHDPLQLAVKPHHFEMHVEYLAEHFHILSVDEMVAHLMKKEPFRGPSVVLTFDGGYAELLYTVQGILKQFGACATAFIPSAGMLDREPMWYDQLEDFLVAGQACGELELFIDEVLHRWPLRSRRERFTAYEQLFSILAQRPSEERTDILNQLKGEIGHAAAECDSHRMLSAQEVRRMAEEGVIAVGGYTHHGISPTCVGYEECLAEIAKNKEVLDEVLGHPIRYFSYPSWCAGKGDQQVADMLRNQGFKLAFGNDPATFSAKDQVDLFQVPRVRVGDRNLFAIHQLLRRFFCWAQPESSIHIPGGSS